LKGAVGTFGITANHVEERIMLKRCLVILAVPGVCLLAAAPSASAAGAACPAAFQALTIEQAVEIKLALGYPLTAEELEAALRGC
jgi:hypothetical protein